MAPDLAQAVVTLNGLIQTCKDGEGGFEAAAELARHSELQQLLRSYSRQRGQFVVELKEEVRRLGGDPEAAGSLAGTLHRGWINVKAVVTGKDDAGTIAECERGEESARTAYEEALKVPLPESAEALVRRHFDAVQEAHGRLRALQTVTGGASAGA